MLTIGVDAHKRVQQAVAIDMGGREVGRWRGGTTPAEAARLAAWATGLAGERRGGIEGSHQYGRVLAQHLVGAGEAVVEVNPRLTAGMRRGSRARGKSDRLDALAVARIVAQEGDALPVVGPDDAQLASYAGVAPLEAASGEHTRHRLNRGGNRPLTALLHRIALVQGRCAPEARAYLARRHAEGRTEREATRCLKRHIARRVFRAWGQCTLPPLTEITVPLI